MQLLPAGVSSSAGGKLLPKVQWWRRELVSPSAGGGDV